MITHIRLHERSAAVALAGVLAAFLEAGAHDAVVDHLSLVPRVGLLTERVVQHWQLKDLQV